MRIRIRMESAESGFAIESGFRSITISSFTRKLVNGNPSNLLRTNYSHEKKYLILIDDFTYLLHECVILCRGIGIQNPDQDPNFFKMPYPVLDPSRFSFNQCGSAALFRVISFVSSVNDIQDPEASSLLKSTVPDPCHFGVDTDPRIHASEWILIRIRILP